MQISLELYQIISRNKLRDLKSCQRIGMEFIISWRIKEIGQKDKQRSTKHTHQTKDWVTRTYVILGKIYVRIPA
jgi:hypothetical protein